MGPGCGPTKTMQEEAKEVKKVLLEKFGEVIKFSYLDVLSEEIMNYPKIVKLLDKVNLPLIAINGEPRFYGGFSMAKLEEAIDPLLK